MISHSGQKENRQKKLSVKNLVIQPDLSKNPSFMSGNTRLKIFLTPPENLLCHSLAQFAEAVDIVRDIAFHIVVQPFDDNAEAFAFVKAYDEESVFLGNSVLRKGGIYVCLRNMGAYLPEIVLIHFPVGRSVDMQDGFFVLDSKGYGEFQSLLDAFNPGIFLDDTVSLVFENFFHKRRQILVVVIEGIAVYAAVLDNVLYCYLMIGLFIQQLYAGAADSLFR